MVRREAGGGSPECWLTNACSRRVALEHRRAGERKKMVPDPPRDRNGSIVSVGDRVRLLSLSGRWFDELPPDERDDVMSMVDAIFEIEQIDEYGHPWIRKSWPNEEAGTCRSHSVAVEPQEIELVTSDHHADDPR